MSEEQVNPQPQELEQMAAAFLGEPVPESPKEQPKSQPQEKVETAQVETPKEGEPAQIDPMEELRTILKETPYYQEGRDVKEVAAQLSRGYKELQGTHTKLSQKVKSLEPILDLAASDPSLANFLQQAATLYRNPHLASAYVNPQGNVNTRPDPRMYDMTDPAHYQQFNTDLENWTSRQLDERLNTRLSSMEQRQQLELYKMEFRKSFPDANPEEVVAQMQSLTGQNPLVFAWKALSYDTLKSSSMEAARKEVSTKLEEAQKTKTPQASSPSKPVNMSDIVEHIKRYGASAAIKRYGQEKVEGVLRETARFV